MAEPSQSQRDSGPQTPTWLHGALALVHELWGDAVREIPYTPAQKAKWCDLLEILQRQQHTAYPLRVTPPNLGQK